MPPIPWMKDIKWGGQSQLEHKLAFTISQASFCFLESYRTSVLLFLNVSLLNTKSVHSYYLPECWQDPTLLFYYGVTSVKLLLSSS